MDLTTEQKDFYTKAREHCRTEVGQMNNTIRREWEHLNSEIRRVENLMGDLEQKKQVVGQMHGSASAMLGLPDDLDVSPAIQEAAAEA